MKRNRVSALTAGVAVVVGSALTSVAPAVAADANPYDPTFVPAASDVVGVGSDTTQIVTHDIARAYNQGRATGRLASFAADGAPATVTLRAGAAAITRPNGSGAGKKLLFGTDNDPNVSFARSSSSLSDAEIAGGLKQAAFAVDGLQMAVNAGSTNAPASLTIAQILGIYKGDYTNWSQVGGKPGTIKALIPQSGSGTLSFFTSQLAAANGGISFTPVATSTQEHSAADIAGNPNAIAPFSSARASISPTVRLAGGWKATRAVYNVLRTSDLSNGTLGPVLGSIFGENGWICGPDGRAVIEAAGFDQLASTEDGGACGELVTDPVSNLKTASEVAADTTTTLTAAAPGGRKVVLKATVKGGSSSPAGKVEFFEGGTKVATAFASGGVATATLTGVSAGVHRYVATFVPNNVDDFAPSTSAAQTVTVKTVASVAVSVRTAPFGKAKSVTVKAVADGKAAAGAVSVKVGSAAARSYRLTAAGTATVPVAANTRAGSHRIVVTLPASATAEAASGQATLKVVKARASVAAKLSKKKIKAKQRGVVVVRVPVAGTAKGIQASGRVTIKSGRKVVGTAVVRNGKATIKLKKLKKGTYKLVTTYGGNANVLAAKGKTLTLKVTK